MSGFNVTPSQLHQAGATLRSVQSELAAKDMGAVGDVGYPDLAQAIQDFASTAGDTAQGLSTAVTKAGDNVSRGGTGYEQSDAANARAAAGGLQRG